MPARPGQPGDPARGIGVAAGILMVGSLASRVLGLVREQLAAGYFGAGDDIAAFTVADNLQTLVFDLMVSGALQAALIPVLAQLVLPGRMEQPELRRVGGALVAWTAIAGGMLALLGIIFAPALVDLLVWISGDDTARGVATEDLTVRLVRILLPAAALLGIGTVLQGMLHGLGAVSAPAMSAAVRNAAIIVAIVVLASPLGVASMAWGTLAGAALIVAIQVWPLSRRGALPIPNLAFRHPAVRRIGVLYLPVFIGLLVSSAAVVIDRGLAWGAGELAIGAMRYATTLVQLVLGLVAAAMALASLPALSRHFGHGDERAYAATLGRVVGMVTVLIVPAAVGLAVLAVPVTTLLFGHGATGPDGVDAISLALLGYLPGMVAAAYDQVLTFALFARHNTRLPVVIGIVSVGVYLVVAFGLVDRFGMMGLVVANSAMFIARAAVMWWAVWQAGVRLPREALRHTAIGTVLGTVAMAVIATGSLLAIERFAGLDTGYGAPLGAQIALVGIPIAAGAAGYIVVLHRVRVRELENLVGAVRARLGT